MNNYKINIPDYTDLEVNFQDEGIWRSYEVSDLRGNTIEEALSNCTVSETDQDGGGLNCYSYEDASRECQRAIERLLHGKLVVTQAMIAEASKDVPQEE